MKKLLTVFLIIFAIGCQKKTAKWPTEPVAPQEQIREEVMKPEKMEKEEVTEFGLQKEGQVSEREMSIDELEEKAKSIFQDVLFDYDRYDIRSDARPVLNTVAAFLNENKIMNVIIEGHCDERGTNEYNLALGEKRAKAAKDYLISLGISPSRLIVVTYGEEKPACEETSETCWQQNRRAHFVVSK